MEIVWFIVGVAVALLGVLVVGFVWSARGILTLDTGWARSTHPLGPITVLIDAPREVAFEQISGVYLGRRPPTFGGSSRCSSGEPTWCSPPIGPELPGSHQWTARRMAAVPILKIESKQRALYGGCERRPLTQRSLKPVETSHAAIGT
jgi:hypothetical protein